MKRILSLLLSVLAFCSVFTLYGCTEKPAPETTVVFSDFEKFEPDFQLIRPMNRFGNISVNQDETFVKNGKTSAKLQPLGNYSNGDLPFIYIPFMSKRFAYDYTNFAKIKSVTLWIYNAQDQMKEVEFGYVMKVINIETVEKLSYAKYQIENGWTKLVIYPDMEQLSLIGNPKSVAGIYLGFDNANSRDIEDAPVFYIDDIVIKLYGSEVATKDVVQLEQGEIADFEQEWQRKMISVFSPKSICTPAVSIINATDENLTATSGEKLLKVVMKAGDKAGGTYPRFIIPEKVMQSSGVKDIDQKEYANYEFKFDVYAKTEKVIYFTFTTSGGWSQKVIAFVPKANEWNTFSLSFTDVNISAAHVSNPGILSISWPEHVVGGDITMYFDNFRFEKIA